MKSYNQFKAVLYKENIDVKLLTQDLLDYISKDVEKKLLIYPKLNLDKVQALIDKGADINIHDRYNNFGSLLSHAIYRNDFPLVKLLIKNNIDINSPNSINVTPIYLAANKGYYNILKYLIKHGGDVNICNGSEVLPVHTALYNNNIDCAILLLKHGKYNNKNLSKYFPVSYKIQKRLIKEFPDIFTVVDNEKINPKIKKEYPEIFRPINAGLWDLKNENKCIKTKEYYDIAYDNADDYIADDFIDTFTKKKYKYLNKKIYKYFKNNNSDAILNNISEIIKNEISIFSNKIDDKINKLINLLKSGAISYIIFEKLFETPYNSFKKYMKVYKKGILWFYIKNFVIDAYIKIIDELLTEDPSSTKIIIDTKSPNYFTKDAFDKIKKELLDKHKDFERSNCVGLWDFKEFNENKEYEPGDIVVCIDSGNGISLTNGKKYKILKKYTSLGIDFIKIIDDSGRESSWYLSRFTHTKDINRGIKTGLWDFKEFNENKETIGIDEKEIENVISNYIDDYLSNKEEYIKDLIKNDLYELLTLSITDIYTNIWANHFLSHEYIEYNWDKRRFGKKKYREVFIKVFNRIMDNVRESLLNKVKKDPSLLKKYPFINTYINIPIEVEREVKTGLWDLKKESTESSEFKIGDIILANFSESSLEDWANKETKQLLEKSYPYIIGKIIDIIFTPDGYEYELHIYGTNNTHGSVAYSREIIMKIDLDNEKDIEKVIDICPDIIDLLFNHMTEEQKEKYNFLRRGHKSGLWDLKKENNNTDWNNLLLLNAENCDLDGVINAVESGADVNYQINDRDKLTAFYSPGYTALMYAAESGELDIVKYLVKNGANMNLVADDTNTALILAGFYVYVDIVEYLIKKGAKLDIRDGDGRTGIDWIFRNGNRESIKRVVRCILENRPEGINLIKDYEDYIEIKQLKSEYPDLFRSSKVGLWDLKTESKSLNDYDFDELKNNIKEFIKDFDGWSESIYYVVGKPYLNQQLFSPTNNNANNDQVLKALFNGDTIRMRFRINYKNKYDTKESPENIIQYLKQELPDFNIEFSEDSAFNIYKHPDRYNISYTVKISAKNWVKRSIKSNLWDLKTESYNEDNPEWSTESYNEDNPEWSIDDDDFDFDEFVKDCSFDDIKKYLNEGGDINRRDDGGDTILAGSVNTGRIDEVEYLLNNGANLSNVNNKGENILYWLDKKRHNVDKRKISIYLINYILDNYSEGFIIEHFPNIIEYFDFATEKNYKKYKHLLRSNKSGLWDLKR